MIASFRTLFALLAAVLPAAGLLAAGEGPLRNLLANPDFELGRDSWRLDKAGKTAAEFTVDRSEAFSGQNSGLIKVGTVDEWGTQFGQTVEAPAAGTTYTFAVMAKGLKGPPTVMLEIERPAKPWDRAVRSQPFTLNQNSWTELHVTFKVEKPFKEGWFAYVSCTQPGAEYRLDAFRLYEGQYVPYRQQAQAEKAASGVSLYDTAVPLATAPGSDELARKPGWVKWPEDETGRKFRGDAAMLNDRLAVVLRRGAPGAEVYALRAEGGVCRVRLGPATGAAIKLDAVTAVENAAGAVSLDATFRGADARPLVIRYELSMGQPFVRTEARQNVAALRVQAPCRYVVLPDFFADDLVVDAAGIPVPETEVPSENFLLHLIGGGEAIVASVSGAREQDAQVALSGDGDARTIQHSDVFYGKDRQIWVAVLEGRGIWHQQAVSQDDAGKVLSLPWKAPYPAQWRVDWRRSDGLASSWEMLSQLGSGEFEKHGWFGGSSRMPADRKRWTTVLGSFQYPCWIDREGQGCLQPLKSRVLVFDGPALIYPINRVGTTPLRELTVVDLMRATLGVGPCEYILDVEGQAQTYKGRSTCGTRDALRAIYASRQQKQKRAEVGRLLDDVAIFVKHIRGRIEQYVDFGHQMLDYLQQQRKGHPELAEFLDEMEKLTRSIDLQVERRKAEIKTTQYVVDLTEKFRATLLDNETEEALPQCKAITEAIVRVGGNQDELVGECRLAVRILRQRAGLAMAQNPRAAEVANEIRRRCQAVLRNPTSYEAPRQ